MGKQWMSSRERASTEVLPLNLSLYHAARDYPGGIKAVAAVHGLNPTTLQHKLSPTHEPHKANIDDLEAVLSTTLDPRVLDSLGEIGGGAIWVIPADLADDEPELGMLGSITQLQEGVSEMLRSLTESLKDKILDVHESRELSLRVRRLMSYVLAVELAAQQFEEGE